jgi:hypothetical protein
MLFTGLNQRFLTPIAVYLMWQMKKPWSFTSVCPAPFHCVILRIEYFYQSILLVSLFCELPSSGNVSCKISFAVGRKYIISCNCFLQDGR